MDDSILELGTQIMPEEEVHTQFLSLIDWRISALAVKQRDNRGCVDITVCREQRCSGTRRGRSFTGPRAFMPQGMLLKRKKKFCNTLQLCRFDSRHISNIHCKIFCEKRGSESNIVFVMDFSSNGTYVNGKRIQKVDNLVFC